MVKIRLGPAGSSGHGSLEGIRFAKEQGLNCMEIEFVRGVHMKNELAKECGELARELDIELSVHSPYYVNLASAEERKRRESAQRILDSCERGHHLGAREIVFHPAYYGKLSPETTYEIVKKAILDMQGVIEKNHWNVRLSPETTGKVSAFGNLEETLRLVKDTGCSFNIDFAHLFARARGHIDYKAVLEQIEEVKPEHIQCHFSNINYGLKGELNHLNMDSRPPFEPLARELLRRGIDTTIISETPDTWKSSLKMKKIFEKLGHKF